MIIYLIGYMGSGKSTLGKLLSNALGYGFMDLDAAIESKEGRSIAAIFDENGEGYFRKVETEMVKATSALSDTVVSTGGGSPCFADNMQAMNDSGITVYLKHDPRQLAKRLIPGKAKRPKIAHLSDEELVDHIRKHLGQREPFYNQAKLIVENTSRNSVDELVEKIMKYK